MNRSVWQVFALLFVVCVLMVGCGPKKSVQELNPNVSFMDKNQVEEFLSGSQTDSAQAIVTYKENGKASVYVKAIGKDIDATWKIKDDGMVVLNTPKRINKLYFVSDGKSAYNVKGEHWEFKKD